MMSLDGFFQNEKESIRALREEEKERGLAMKQENSNLLMDQRYLGEERE